MYPSRPFAALLGTLLAIGAHAADGDPDASFSGDGVAFADWAGGPVQNIRVAVDAQGSVLVGGTITRTGNDDDFAVARLRSNGTIDTGFGYFGYRTVAFNRVDAGHDPLMGIFPLADGKVMLLGRAEVADEIVAAAPAAMARLTAAGNVDTTFGENGRRVFGNNPWNARMYFRAVARQPDGKFLFGGYCESCSGTYHAVVLRTSATGEPDTTFGTAGWSIVPTPINPRLEAMHVDARGRIVLGGVSSSGGEYHVLLVRMTADGQADASFGTDGSGVSRPQLPAEVEAEWTVTSLASDRDGSLYLGVRNFGPIDGGNRGGVARLHADGSRDMDYGLFGLHELTREEGSRIETIALRSDGRLVAAGSIVTSSGRHDFYVARLLPGGGLDPDFDGNGVARYEITDTQNDALAMTLAAGKPVIAGHTYQTNASVAVLRLQSDLIFADGFQ